MKFKMFLLSVMFVLISIGGSVFAQTRVYTYRMYTYRAPQPAYYMRSYVPGRLFPRWIPVYRRPAIRTPIVKTPTTEETIAPPIQE
jgi:hypothetical protein